ncbi:MAG TPA: nitroreductase family protein [Candidatus Flavonifractor merdavium]|nr:nitroreductase family protein [Candidatus Flavonifractor merdavium]
MNETLAQLHARKSVRAYLDKPVVPEEKRAILEAACAAPTAGNQQLYTILDITDQAVKATLADTCDHQPFIAQAPLVLIFCADCQKWYDAYQEGGCQPREPGPGDLLLAFSDANIAAQNAVTAAWSLGIGSCYIGDILERCETHRALLGLPEYVVPAAMVVFGYPTDQQKAREKPHRRAMEHIVHENAYRRMDGAELEAMLADHAGQRSYTDWLQAFCQRKYNSDFSREMSRSAVEYLKRFLPEQGV